MCKRLQERATTLRTWAFQTHVAVTRSYIAWRHPLMVFNKRKCTVESRRPARSHTLRVPVALAQLTLAAERWCPHRSIRTYAACCICPSSTRHGIDTESSYRGMAAARVDYRRVRVQHAARHALTPNDGALRRNTLTCVQPEATTTGAASTAAAIATRTCSDGWIHRDSHLCALCTC